MSSSLSLNPNVQMCKEADEVIESPSGWPVK